MYTEFLNGQKNFSKPYNYLDNFLIKFGENAPFSICIKDIDTKTVRMYNSLCSKFWGFTNTSMEGLTAREIFTRVPNFNNVEEELANLEKIEYLTVQKDQQLGFKQILLSYNGFVQIRHGLITPLYGINKRCIATVGVGLDLTQTTNPLSLLKCYQHYYPSKSEAVEKFLNYFNVATYFHKLISLEELRTLLTMLRDTRHKQVAEALSVSPKTVASYLSSIRDKLNPTCDIYDILNILRSQRTRPPGWEQFTGN
jgi:hypothetical protein